MRNFKASEKQYRLNGVWKTMKYTMVYKYESIFLIFFRFYYLDVSPVYTSA